MRNPASCICKIKGADQLCSNRAADQHLYFCYMDGTIPLLAKSSLSDETLNQGPISMRP